MKVGEQIGLHGTEDPHQDYFDQTVIATSKKRLQNPDPKYRDGGRWSLLFSNNGAVRRFPVICWSFELNERCRIQQITTLEYTQ
jgi:hypothetical protein